MWILCQEFGFKEPDFLKTKIPHHLLRIGETPYKREFELPLQAFFSSLWYLGKVQRWKPRAFVTPEIIP